MERGEDRELNITYEILFDILRNEKKRQELQKLSKTFFQDLIRYLKEKKEIVDGPQRVNIFAAEEREKASSQLKNIKKILTELYARREKKIIELALDKSQIKSNVDTGSLLDEEKMLFEQLVILFDKYREGILFKIVEGKSPDFEERGKIERKEDAEEKGINEASEEKEEAEKEPEETEKTTKMVRFIYAVPRFVGKELETYGPFEEEDITTLPTEIADVLIVKGRAEEIQERQ